MRGALTQADGFSNVNTDITKTTVSFNYSKSEGELKTKLDDLSKSNEHIKGWKKNS